MRKIALAPDVDARVIARGTPGFSGADLANLVNEAALLAARKNKRLVAMVDFEEAKDKVIMGAERRSAVMTEDEKRSTAYHEAGHALVSLLVPNNDPLHKVTIIPRGRSLGSTWNLPERDRFSMSMKQMKARLALCFGGRIAEQLIYGDDELNTGAANDIQQATRMAHAMVTEYGMSEKLGWLRYRENQDEVFLGHSVARNQSVSEDTARLIDEETRSLIEEAETTARGVLTKHLDDLHVLAKALLEYETLTGDEINALLRGEEIRPDLGDSKPTPGRQILLDRAADRPSARREADARRSRAAAGDLDLDVLPLKSGAQSDDSDRGEDRSLPARDSRRHEARARGRCPAGRFRSRAGRWPSRPSTSSGAAAPRPRQVTVPDLAGVSDGWQPTVDRALQAELDRQLAKLREPGRFSHRIKPGAHVRPLVMGIVNVTPDSFSDGGQFLDPDRAIDHGRRLIEDGADILDIGGESTRPGATPITIQEEIDRVLPVIEGLKGAGVPISIDTRHAEVMRAAHRRGRRDHQRCHRSRPAIPTASSFAGGVDAPVVLMHMQGEPGTMQDNPRYDDVVIGCFRLSERPDRGL